jgi:hypothetical protein
MTANATTFQGYPRKFSEGPIAGTSAAYPRTPNNTVAITTDQHEFWAYGSLNFTPLIDTTTYQVKAKQVVPVAWPQAQDISGGALAANPAKSWYYDAIAANTTAYFDATFAGTFPGAVIWVHGNAVLDNASIDLSTGAFIVEGGSLTLRTHVAGSGLPGNPNLRLPNTAALEYYYWTNGLTEWPCFAQSNLPNCPMNIASASPVNVRGFMWAKNGLWVNQPGWILDGSVLVGDLQAGSGTLNTTGGTLTLFYDDTINHSILVQGKPIQLQIDLINIVAAQ